MKIVIRNRYIEERRFDKVLKSELSINILRKEMNIIEIICRMK